MLLDPSGPDGSGNPFVRNEQKIEAYSRNCRPNENLNSLAIPGFQKMVAFLHPDIQLLKNCAYDWKPNPA